MVMNNEKSELIEVLTDMSQFAGALVGAAVIVGKKAINRITDLIAVQTNIKPPIKPAKSDKKTKSKAN